MKKSDIKKWEWFNINDIFIDIKKGERLTKLDRVKGNMPLLTAVSVNNGVAEFIDKGAYEKKKIYKDKITIDMFFNTFYHDYEYFSDDNVHTLIPKDRISKYSSIFLSTILKKNQFRYAYGRQVRLIRLNDISLQLPAKNGKPDYEYMEEYIKKIYKKVERESREFFK